MPWKVTEPMDLKREFIGRLNRGERMTDLCVEYGISRKTGHKLQRRHAGMGDAGLVERSRAPRHIPHKTPPDTRRLPSHKDFFSSS